MNLMKKLNPYLPWAVWFLGALFYAYEFFQRVAPGIIAKPLMASFHITANQLGSISSLYFVVYAIAQIPVGVCLDKFGVRNCLSIAALCVAAGTFMFSGTHSIYFLGFARVLVGIGSAFAFVGTLKLAANWFPATIFALVVGITNMIGTIGALVGQVPLSYMVSSLGWERALNISAWVGIALAAALFVFLRDKPKISPNPAVASSRCKLTVKQSLLLLIRKPQSWYVAIYAGIMVSPVIAFTELWAIPFFESVDKLTSHQAAMVNQMILIGIAIGAPSNGFISGLLKRRKIVMGTGQLFAILALLALIFIPMPEHVLMIFTFIFGFSVSSMLLAFSTNTEIHAPKMGASVIAFTNLFIMLIGAFFQKGIGYALSMLNVDVHASNALTTSSVFEYSVAVLPAALLLNYFFLWKMPETKCQNISSMKNCV